MQLSGPRHSVSACASAGVFEPTDNLLDTHLSSLTSISALTFSVAILSLFMPRLKSRVVNCRELLQSSAQRRPQCWRDERNCLPERQYTTHTPGVGIAHGVRRGDAARPSRDQASHCTEFARNDLMTNGLSHFLRFGRGCHACVRF